jgi:hypothetical protein
MNSTATPNHPLQRTAPRVTVAAILAWTSSLRAVRSGSSDAHSSVHHAATAPPSAVAELKVVRRRYAPIENESNMTEFHGRPDQDGHWLDA